jgi:excisionase family DNA binding protein
VKEAIVSSSILKTQERLFTIPEVGAVLQVSEKTVRRWITAGELPAAKLGNQWRIRPRDLDDFVRDRLVR